MGCAIVTTSVGCEGIPAVSGEHLFIEDDPQAFAQRVVALLGNPELRRQVGENARALVVHEYDLEGVVHRRAAIFDALIQQHAQHPACAPSPTPSQPGVQDIGERDKGVKGGQGYP